MADPGSFAYSIGAIFFDKVPIEQLPIRLRTA